MSESISINVKASNDKKYVIAINTSETVLNFKTKIALNCDTPADRMRLIYSGRVLKDLEPISTYKIAEGHTVHMVRGAPVSSTTTSTPAVNTPITTTAPPSSSPSRTTAASPQSVTPDPTSSSASPDPWTSMTYGAIPRLGGMGGMGGMGMEAGMMGSMMQDPNFAQYMSSMLQNPQVLESMFATNPMLQSMGPEVRQMLHSPEFQQLISNPDMLRQVAQMGAGDMGSALGVASGTRGGMFNTWGSPPARASTAGTSPPRPSAASPFTAYGNGTGAHSMANLWPQYMASVGSGTGHVQPQQQHQQQQPSTQPPEQRFQVQLQQLNEMGFWDASKNVQALVAAGGNVDGAIELLFSGAI